MTGGLFAEYLYSRHMTTLAFDGRAGASGDLVPGALLAAGADRDALAPSRR